MNNAVFISYRREDAAGFARALYNRLASEFGPERIFMDVDTIAPGIDFVTEITTAVGNCRTLLAVIGDEWLSAKDAEGRRRIDVPDDYVRLEIANALNRNIRVVPVLIEDTHMPGSEDLPDEIKPLARRNALRLTNARFDADTQLLIDTLQSALDEPAASPASASPKSKTPLVAYIFMGVVAVAIAVSIITWPSRQDARDPPEVSSPTTTTAPESIDPAPPVIPAATPETEITPPAVTDPPAPTATPTPEPAWVANPRLPVAFKEQHEYKSDRWGYVEGVLSDGKPASIRGTFRLKSEHTFKGIKAYVLVQLIDKRDNVLKEIKARTWVSGKLTPNRSEHTINFDEHVAEAIRRDIVNVRVRFVFEQ